MKFTFHSQNEISLVGLPRPKAVKSENAGREFAAELKPERTRVVELSSNQILQMLLAPTRHGAYPPPPSSLPVPVPTFTFTGGFRH